MPQAASASRRTAAKRPKPGLPRKFYRPRDHHGCAWQWCSNFLYSRL